MIPSSAKFVCGAECGLASIGTLSIGTEHWLNIQGTPTVVTSGPSPMRSTRCYRFDPAGAQEFLYHFYQVAVSSGAASVGRCYIYFTTLPSGDTPLVSTDSNGVWFKQSDSKIYAGWSGIPFTPGPSGVSVTTGVWYRLDWKIKYGASNWTVDVSVNGVACGQATNPLSALGQTNIAFGSVNTIAADFYIDDIIVSGTEADFPIGDGTVVGLYPNGDKTSSAAAGVDDGAWSHRYTAGTVFGKGAGGVTNLGAQNVESTSWQSLANPLSASIGTNFIAAKTPTTIADHLTWTLLDLPSDASVLHGVMITVATHTASNTTATFALTITRANGQSFTIQGGSDFSEATITLPTFLPHLYNGGVGTIAEVNAAQLTFWSTDTNPDVYLDGIVMEVGYVATPSGDFTSISPAIFTLAPVALTAAASGDAARTLTSAAFTLSPVALVRSVGTATTSISPVTVTLTPTSLTGQATIDPQFTSISPVAMTLSPQPVATSVGGASRTVSPVTISLVPIALTRSVGGVSTSITSVTMTLSPITLVRSVGDITTSVSPAIFTMTAVAVTRTLGMASTSLSPVTVTLNAVTLTYSVGDTARTLTPVILSLTAVALVPLVLVPQSTSISPVTFMLTPVVLTRSVGGVSTSVSPVIFTVSAIAVTRSVGTVIISISPTTVSLIPIALTRSVGGTTRSISPVTLTFTAFVITGFVAVPGTGNISPVTITLSPTALTRSVGSVSRSITSVNITLIPVALTRSIGDVSRTLTPITITFVANGVTYSIGTVTNTINPVILSLIASVISVAGIGGMPKVWTGSEWEEKPVKFWTGTVWVEKPMKVWTGSEWELV